LSQEALVAERVAGVSFENTLHFSIHLAKQYLVFQQQ
jgi:hypothetical protein